jgi:hypothetical protein
MIPITGGCLITKTPLGKALEKHDSYFQRGCSGLGYEIVDDACAALEKNMVSPDKDEQYVRHYNNVVRKALVKLFVSAVEEYEAELKDNVKHEIEVLKKAFSF